MHLSPWWSDRRMCLPLRNTRCKWFALISFTALALVGCGEDAGLTSDVVAGKITTSIRNDLPAGATMEPLECVQDGDSEHYRCVANTVNQGEEGQLVVSVTCDAKQDSCLYEQVR